MHSKDALSLFACVFEMHKDKSIKPVYCDFVFVDLTRVETIKKGKHVAFWRVVRDGHVCLC